MIDMNKKYRTRLNSSATILTTTRNHSIFPVVALVDQGGIGSVEVYTRIGHLREDQESFGDLIEVTPYDDFVIDEPVMVRDCDDQVWKRRCFAGVDSTGSPRAWDDGAVSWSALDRFSAAPWKYCRRPTPEELAERKP